MFEQILSTNIVNFIIVIYTLALIYKKAHLSEKIQQMSDEIRASVEKSSKDALDAIQEYKTIKKQTKDTPILEKEILSNAENNAQSIKQKIEQKTLIDCKQIEASLNKIQEHQKDKYKNLTVSDVFRASIDLARDEIIARLDFNTHKTLINNAIEDLDKIEGINLE